MISRKDINQLNNFHETTRLLIRDLEARHLQLINRMYQLEQAVEKLSK
jgi:hypothetical protein